MKNILTLLCILAFAPAVFAGGTMIYTTPGSNGQTNWYEDADTAQKSVKTKGKKGSSVVTEESSFEKKVKVGKESTYRTKSDKYYNHGGVKFGTGFSTNGTTGRW